MSKAKQFIEDYTNNGSNQIINGKYGAIIPIFAPWLTPEQALRAVEIEREELIEKACEWLKNYLQGIAGGSIYISDFRNYMEGE